jgi:hypothetical protein
MVGVAIQNIEYIESGGPILMDVLWAVIYLAIVAWGYLINAVVLVPDVEVAGLQEALALALRESVVENGEGGQDGNQQGPSWFEDTAQFV